MLLNTSDKRVRMMLIIQGAILGIAIALAGLARLMTLDGVQIPFWIAACHEISAMTGYSKLSGLGYAADVYYTIVPITWPISAIYTYRLAAYRPDGSYTDWMKKDFSTEQKIVFIPGVFVTVVFPVLLFFSFRGQDARLLVISGTFWDMATKGWITFAGAGCVFSGGILTIQKLIIKLTSNQ